MVSITCVFIDPCCCIDTNSSYLLRSVPLVPALLSPVAVAAPAPGVPVPVLPCCTRCKASALSLNKARGRLEPVLVIDTFDSASDTTYEGPFDETLDDTSSDVKGFFL